MREVKEDGRVKLTETQSSLLEGLDGIEGWMSFDWLKPELKSCARRLKIKGLVAIRGGVGVPSIRLPVQVKITDAGRAALAAAKGAK